MLRPYIARIRIRGDAARPWGRRMLRPYIAARPWGRRMIIRSLPPAAPCTRCPALVASRRCIVPGRGDLASGIVVIGEAPGGKGADRTGLPFHGDRSGRALDVILVALGLADPPVGDAPAVRRCFVTNVVRCRPPGNRAPTPTEIAACAEWLDHELALVDPWLIIPAGRLALQAVGVRWLGRDPGPIRALHAQPLHAGTTTILPLIHPSRLSHHDRDAFIAAAAVLVRGRV